MPGPDLEITGGGGRGRVIQTLSATGFCVVVFFFFLNRVSFFGF